MFIGRKKKLSSKIEELKSHFEIYEKDRKQVFDDDVQRILNLLLDEKINEKEASEILKSMSVSQDERDNFFEEYLIIKMNKDKRKEKSDNDDFRAKDTDDSFFTDEKFKDRDIDEEAKKNNQVLMNKLDEVINVTVNKALESVDGILGAVNNTLNSKFGDVDEFSSKDKKRDSKVDESFDDDFDDELEKNKKEDPFFKDEKFDLNEYDDDEKEDHDQDHIDNDEDDHEDDDHDEDFDDDELEVDNDETEDDDKTDESDEDNY